MKTLGYYNGEIGELDTMRIPMLDRACYFGDGVYDVTYCRNYRIFALDEHANRFFKCAEQLKIVPNISKEAFCELLYSLIRRMDSGDLWIYFQFSRGTAPRAHVFPQDTPPNLWIMLKPGGIQDVYRPFRCITLEDTRYYHCNIKTLNLLPNVLAAQATEEAGVDEAILHRGDTVTECSHSNISILKDGVLITHPTNQFILAGIGRAHLIAACRKTGISVIERPYTLSELMDADEAYITSASALCMRVIEVDGVPIGGRNAAITKRLQDDLLNDYLEATAP